MTLQPTRTKKADRPRVGTICMVCLLFFCLALWLKRADVVAECMRSGLSLCAHSLVPSLFPFLVLSDLILSSGAGELVLSPLAMPLGRILRLSRTGASAVLMGLICGFPVGARCAITAYEADLIDRGECERILVCSSIPSPAFLISTVGGTLWGNARFGVLLLISAILSALLSGILLYVVQKKQNQKPFPKPSPLAPQLRFNGNMFTAAVKNATTGTLLICAYVVFFSPLAEAVIMVLGRVGASAEAHALISSVLELSGGVSAAATLLGEWSGIALTGMAVGWSGISVHCQLLSICGKSALSLKPYLFAKLMQGILCPAFLSALCKLFL